MRGGKRQGAGRKAGLPNKATQARQAKVESTGITPLDVMIANMRQAYAEAQRADEELTGARLKELAKAEDPFKAILAEVKKAVQFRKIAQTCAADAAPYIHPKLASTEVTGKDGGPVAGVIDLNVRFVSAGK